MITKSKSLEIYSTLFLVCMLLGGYDRFNQIYILMKHSVVDINVPGIVLCSAELGTYLAIAILLSKIVKNIRNQIIFDRKNVRMFRGMAIAVLVPTVVHVICNFLAETTAYSIGHSMGSEVKYWITALLFLSIITEIFRYGMRLKEEQDLTV